MGAIKLATSENTDEEYGGTFGATVALSIPANTYSTWALALEAMETAFNSLSSESKIRSILVRGENVIYYMNSLTDKRFSCESVSGTSHQIQSFILSNHKFYNFLSSNSPQYTDISGNAQNQKLELIIV